MFDKIDYSGLAPQRSIVKPRPRSRGSLLVCLSGLALVAGAAWGLYLLRTPPIVGGPPLLMPLPVPASAGPDEQIIGPPLVAVDFFKDGKSDEKDRFGISLLQLDDPNPAFPGARKRLFQDFCGASNNTRIELNGTEFVFGNKYANAQYQQAPKTRRVLRDQPVQNLPRHVRGWQSVVRYEVEMASIEVTQDIRVIPGPSHRLDTVLVRYTVRNTGNTSCTVAMRSLLDTYIGATDGVPFYAPPAEGKPGHWVDKGVVLHNKEIPDVFHALESADLTDPGSVHAVLRMRLPGFEEPTKCVICRPPSANDGNAGWGHEAPRLEDWVYQPMDEPADAPKDSCVVIYWDKRNMWPRETRVVGYTYGLGRMFDPKDDSATLASADGKQMALEVVRSERSDSFVVTAFLKGTNDEQVTLRLPPTVEFAQGEVATKKVDGTPDRAAASWRVRLIAGRRHELIADAPGIGAAKLILDQALPPGCSM